MKRYSDLAATPDSSGVRAQVGEQARRLAERLARVRRIVVVMSGKGGVGKSAVTANLAAACAAAGERVGAVDADINGPSLPLLLGARGRAIGRTPEGLAPAAAPCGVRLISTDLLVPADGAAVVWRAPTQADAWVWRGAAEASALREFLGDAVWGELDWLFLDLPPGADRIATVLGLLPERAAVLAVTAPAAVSVLSVGRALELSAAAGRRALGLVENFAAAACPRCGADLDPGGAGAVEGLALAAGVPVLGRVPYDPALRDACDAGTPLVLARPAAPAAQALLALAARLRERVPPGPAP